MPFKTNLYDSDILINHDLEVQANQMKLPVVVCFIASALVFIIGSPICASSDNQSIASDPNQSDTNQVSSAIIGLIGVFIGGILTLMTPLLSNWLSSKKERELRFYQEESEHNKWIRDQLQQVYSNTINCLSGSVVKGEEAIKCLNILLIYHPNRDSEEYYNFMDKINELYFFTQIENYLRTKRKSYYH
jgi:hypothetical protein